MWKEINGDFLQLLRGFFYVAQTGKVTNAARTMGRNQSTISIQIKKLEEILGISLFQRAGKGMILTPAGQKLYQKSLMLFDIIKDIQTHLAGDSDAVRGSVSLACLNQVSSCWLPQYISAFRESYPNITFIIKTGITSMIQHLVSSGEVDFGIFADTGMIPESFNYRELFRTSIGLVVPDRQDCGLGQPIKESDLLNMQFIGFSEDCLVHKKVDNFFLSRKKVFNPIIRVQYYEQILSYVDAGQGAGILEKFIFDSSRYTNMKFYSLSHFIDDFSYGLVYKKSKYISPQANLFIKYLFNNLRCSSKTG